MTRLFLLDTNMVSYILRGKSPAARVRLANLGPDEVAGISTIVEGELLYGIAKAKTAAGITTGIIDQIDQRRKSLEWFLGRLKIHSWGREAAAAYGILRARQESMGQTLGPLDMQIAAHAIAIGATLVTRDKAFRQIPNLPAIENWATDL